MAHVRNMAPYPRDSKSCLLVPIFLGRRASGSWQDYATWEEEARLLGTVLAPLIRGWTDMSSEQ